MTKEVKSIDAWEAALAARDDLSKFGDNAIALFALALKFGIDDLESTGTESIVDGGNDKKSDVIYIDEEQKLAVIIQAHKAKSKKSEAPANKASDLNTAVGWLLNTPESKLPNEIRSQAIKLREGINNEVILNLHVWYVHNCPESKNVSEELGTVEHTLRAALKSNFKDKKVKQHVKEIGVSTLSEWYSETQSPIVVNSDFEFPCVGGYEIKEKAWSAYVTAIPAKSLHEAFKEYGVKLFTANVRDYLGSRASDSNINHGIKQTVLNEPRNFWVLNNGLTVLTHKVDTETNPKGETKLSVKGMSIVNGAQTTGAIGGLTNSPSDTAYVSVRFIATSDNALIQDIVRYNNSQNEVTASDFRSTDAVQKRLKREIDAIQDAVYEGGRRGGSGDAIKRRPSLLPSYTVGQALCAFHGDPVTAYNRKTEIWKNDAIYAKLFNEDTTGGHIVFTFSLLRAIESVKVQLSEKSRSETGLKSSEQKQLDFFRTSGATLLYAAAISRCVETFIDEPVPNKFALSFIAKTSPKRGMQFWLPLIHATVAFAKNLQDAASSRLSSAASAEQATDHFAQLVESVADTHQLVFERFARSVKHAKFARKSSVKKN
jgi:hypothetical protein